MKKLGVLVLATAFMAGMMAVPGFGQDPADKGGVQKSDQKQKKKRKRKKKKQA